MGNRKKRTPGPQRHAEGQHGERTHKRFIEMIRERNGAERESDDARGAATERSLENAYSQSHIPHEGDSF